MVMMRRFFSAKCKRCGCLSMMPKVVTVFWCVNCGHKNRTGLGKYGNPLILKTNCAQCGYNFALEPMEHCTNELHRRAHEAAKAEAEAEEARRNAPRVEAAMDGSTVTIKRGQDGRWRFA